MVWLALGAPRRAAGDGPRMASARFGENAWAQFSDSTRRIDFSIATARASGCTCHSLPETK